MKRSLHLLLFFASVLAAVNSCSQSKECNNDVEEKFLPLGFDTELFFCQESKIKFGETFSTMMTRCGLPAADCYRFTRICDTSFDVRKVIADKTVRAYYSGDSLSRHLEYVVYEQDRILSTIFKCSDSLRVWNYRKPVTVERKFSDITITTSLWNDMIRSGANPALIMDLADIYQWSVNFFTLQKGDRFRVIYNQKVCDGEIIAIDSVLFSLFDADGKQFGAARFKMPGEKIAAYWGKDGESLKRMFLKAPLRYNRISSRFSYHRRHPISGKIKAHTAVDYAAPTGTPVHAIGDGTVTQCGWDGSGGGNRIRIKHVKGYESCYMHLSRFAKGIRSGSRVSQGELIGYVGSTGSSTGPHLDFRIWLNKKPVDPLSLNSPASDPLPKQYLEEFSAIYDRYIAEVDSLSHQPHTVAP